MPTECIKKTPKFTAQHYNAIAKDIRAEFERYANQEAVSNTRHEYRSLLDFKLASTGALVLLALRFAERFKEDNEHFDPIKFLNACSPDVDVYPLGELWD